MRKNKILFAAVFAAIMGSTFISCKNNLIPEPTINLSETKNPADYADAILPPKTVTATHGGYRNITLEWSPVENAVRYQIFYARTPFDSFEKLVETADSETTYDIEAPAGSTYYFYIKAVNYFETVSSESIKVTGSTLAIPIITNISASDDAQSVTIEWWMDNCTPETYQNELLFTIKAYDSQKKEIPGATTYKEGNCRSVGISGLEPNTKYFFTVQAEIKEVEQKAEISDHTSKETMHSVIPKNVSDFEASKGITKEYILLSWTLPNGVDYFDSFSNTYKINPLFFDILRKDLSDEKSEYKSIARIGTEGVKDHFMPLTYSFNCKEGTTSNTELITISEYSQKPSLENYENYIPGSHITFKDNKDISEGIHYSYKIIPYTDDTIKEYTPEDSTNSVVTGWDLPSVNFSANTNRNYNENDSDKIDSYDITFNLNFDSNGITYQYVINEKYINLDDIEENKQIGVFTSVADVVAYKKTITTETENQGKYQYELEIRDSAGNELTKEASIGIIQVTDSKANSPLTSFEILDGYKDKFIAKWNYDSNFTYDIEEYLYESDTSNTYKKSTPFPIIPEPQIDGENASYYIPATSGDIATFTINAYSKNDGKWCGSITLNERKHTLGTANIRKELPRYKSITVSWPKVQMANHSNYTVSAKYSDPNLTQEELATAEKTVITENEDFIICTISEPTGFDKAEISGKEIKFTVTSKSLKSEDTTTAVSNVMTLGPAAVTYSVNKTPEKDLLRLKWNKVENVTKYMIYRVLYSDKNKSEIKSADTLIVEDTIDSFSGKRTLSISEIQGQSTENRSILKTTTDSDGHESYILTDMQYDSEEEFGYQLNQEKIQWGLPFGYLILPLEAEASKTDFQFEDLTLSLKPESKVNYGTLENKTANTIGYGLNLHAAKSESASAISLSWDNPNNINGLKPTIYRMAFYKNPEHDYGNKWEKIKTISSTMNTFDDEIPAEQAHLAFIYAVEFEAGSESNLVRSYRNHLASPDTSYEFPAGITEPSNKGYLFAIKDFKADPVESEITESDYFEESVRWDPTWDFEERAIVPSKFTVDIQNKNLSATKDWITLADVAIDSDGKFSITPANLDSTWDTEAEESPARNGINVKPKSLTDAIRNKDDSLQKKETNGLLKVLRDTKHYYSLNISGNGNTNRQAGNNSVYTYRQVTETELAKCVSLIIADAIYQTGVPFLPGGLGGQDYKTVTTNGKTGTFRLQVYGGGTKFWTGNKISWGFESTNYRHQFITGTSSADTEIFTSDFTLNGDNSALLQGVNEFSLYYLPELEITINHTSGLQSYNGTSSSPRKLKFTLGEEGTSKKWILTIKKNDSAIISETTENGVKRYFPMDLGTRLETPVRTVDSTYTIYNKDYGWWN